MEKQNSGARIPGIDDRPMTKEQFAAMWERLSAQTEEVFIRTDAAEQAMVNSREKASTESKKDVAV